MIIKHKFSTVCIIFSLITLISSLPTLQTGNITHLHLVSRFFVTFIAIYTFYIFDWFKNLPNRLLELIHYLVSMGFIFLIVFLSGVFIEPVSPGGYVDIFINYTALYSVFAIIFEIKNKVSAKK